MVIVPVVADAVDDVGAACCNVAGSDMVEIRGKTVVRWQVLYIRAVLVVDPPFEAN